jgi:hypothetical protein
MKKIIIAFDGKHFSEGAFRMAEWLNEKQPVLVAGVFLSPVDYREIIGYSGIGIGTPVLVPVVETNEEEISQNIKRFEERCLKHHIEYRVHKDTDLFAITELITETRFADMLIVSSELFYENVDRDQPNEYLKKTLHQSECPVFVVPENFEQPESIVLAYDGKASSVYAFKQFTYLFPALSTMDALLVYAGDEKSDIPHLDEISELTARHFDNLTLQHLQKDPNLHFSDWISQRKHSLLVTGAYGRGELSSLFKKSFIAEVIKAHRVPVFISHR